MRFYLISILLLSLTIVCADKSPELKFREYVSELRNSGEDTSKKIDIHSLSLIHKSIVAYCTTIDLKAEYNGVVALSNPRAAFITPISSNCVSWTISESEINDLGALWYSVILASKNINDKGYQIETANGIYFLHFEYGVDISDTINRAISSDGRSVGQHIKSMSLFVSKEMKAKKNQ